MSNADPSNPFDLRNDPHDLNNALAQRLASEANARMSWGGASPDGDPPTTTPEPWSGQPNVGHTTSQPVIVVDLPPFDWGRVGRRFLKIAGWYLAIAIVILIGAYFLPA